MCLYKKQEGDTPVPEKKVDLIEMYQERAMRPSPPCSDDEEEQGEGDISGKAAEIHLEESSRHEWAEWWESQSVRKGADDNIVEEQLSLLIVARWSLVGDK